ncbi:DUF6207 family protein [Streptomyces massasporeus]|uniref:DUF6207 family protein n=1 Tax=Streptomyces massasporeus TaxID=67324 RepID=UPI0034104C93
MRQINESHVAAPALAVVEVAAADDDTAFAVQERVLTRVSAASATASGSRRPGGAGRRGRRGEPLPESRGGHVTTGAHGCRRNERPGRRRAVSASSGTASLACSVRRRTRRSAGGAIT